MSLRAKCAPAGAQQVELRFRELAKLQRMILDLQSMIEERDRKLVLLEEENRRAVSAAADSGAVTELRKELAESEAQLAAKAALVDRLSHVVIVKERQRYHSEEESRLLIRELELRQSLSSESVDALRVAALERNLAERDRQMQALNERAEILAAQLAARPTELAYKTIRARAVERAALTAFIAKRHRASMALEQTQTSLKDLVRPTEGYVFLMTYARSGDLLLQTILNSIPGFCVRGENGNALNSLSESLQYLDSMPEPTGNGIEMARNVLGWTVADSFVRNVLAPPAQTRVAGFRESALLPDAERFWTTMDFLYSFFPNARFVFNTRNRRRVIRLGRWAKRPEAEAEADIKVLEGLFRDYTQARPQCSFHVHYDDYIEEPTRLAPLFDFLGEPFAATEVAALIHGGRG